MRFERITIKRFGGLTDFDTGETVLRPLVVVCGPNEAGKSSLFTFLTSILYGFYPASRDRNPYSPWSGGEIDGQARVRLGDGRVLQVHRRLLASPWGQLIENGRVEDIRNRQLDVTSRVPREVFQRVFALTLADLAGLQGESWDAVQDRLIGSMGAADLVPPREVAAQLEQEANQLWRPDRVGKPRAKGLGEELAELRNRRSAAREGDRTIRQKAEELERVKAELHEARAERERCRHLREKVETLGPLRRQLLRIEELREKAGPPEEVEGLPADPRARLAALRTEADRGEARLRRLAEEDVEPSLRIAARTEEIERLLENRASIVALNARMGELLHASSRTAELDAEVRAASQGCEDEARELFSAPWMDLVEGPVERAVEALPSGTLRTAVRDVREAAEETRRWSGARVAREGSAPAGGAGEGTAAAAVDAEDATGSTGDGGAEAGTTGTAESDAAGTGGTGPAEEGAASAAAEPGAEGAGKAADGGRLQPIAGAFLVALGLLLFLAAADHDVLQPLGVVALLFGAMVLAGWWGARRAGVANRAREAAEREREAQRVRAAAARHREAVALYRQAAAREASARQRLDELLGGLPLRDHHRSRPGPELVEGILRLQGHMRERKSREASREKLVQKMGEIREDLARVLARVGSQQALASPLPEPVRAIPLLEQTLRQAEETASAADQAERERARIARDRKEVENALANTRAEVEALEARLERMGEGSRSEGLRRAAERMEARASADAVAAELERGHADLDELRARIAQAEASGGGWVFDDETRTAAAVREKELSLQVEELRARSQGIERDIEHMGERETLDGVEGAIAEVQEEIARLARERDRRVVLAHLLRKADSRFREAHQPDIILRAADHMATITSGRYPGLSIGEEDRKPVFYLQGGGQGRPLPVAEPISTGTREQFYLALRLAIVDHLDADGERLPLFMDEAFVNWDQERRELGFALLEQLSRDRQIFVFTCHEAMADELAARGAHAIRLGGPAPSGRRE